MGQKIITSDRQNRVLITGITGQMGSYLAELYLEKKYLVIGVVRRTSSPNYSRINHLISNPNLILVPGDVTDYSSILRIMEHYVPNEVAHLAAQSHVHISFNEPIHTWNVVANGCLNVLEAIRTVNADIRMVNMASSEMFGNSDRGLRKSMANGDFQCQTTDFAPTSPYAIAKLASYHFTKLYREAYGIHASNMIMFNAESPRRGENFVTRKVTKYVAKLFVDKWGNENFNVDNYPKLKLGNLEAKRDWSYVKDNCEGLFLMLQKNKPDDYIVGTGKTHSIKELLTLAFSFINEPDWLKYVEQDASLFRPSDVNYLCADMTETAQKLHWQPKTTFAELIEIMVKNDIREEKLQRPQI